LFEKKTNMTNTIDTQTNGNVQTSSSEAELNQRLCKLIPAFLHAQELHGITITAAKEPWQYNVRHIIASDLNQHDIALDALGVAVNDMLEELRCRYGEKGEAMFDERVYIELKEQAL
jgi:hypothetical protein